MARWIQFDLQKQILVSIAPTRRFQFSWHRKKEKVNSHQKYLWSIESEFSLHTRVMVPSLDTVSQLASDRFVVDLGFLVFMEMLKNKVLFFFWKNALFGHKVATCCPGQHTAGHHVMWPLLWFDFVAYLLLFLRLLFIFRPLWWLDNRFWLVTSSTLQYAISQSYPISVLYNSTFHSGSIKQTSTHTCMHGCSLGNSAMEPMGKIYFCIHTNMAWNWNGETRNRIGIKGIEKADR